MQSYWFCCVWPLHNDISQKHHSALGLDREPGKYREAQPNVDFLLQQKRLAALIDLVQAPEGSLTDPSSTLIDLVWSGSGKTHFKNRESRPATGICFYYALQKLFVKLVSQSIE